MHVLPEAILHVGCMTPQRSSDSGATTHWILLIDDKSDLYHTVLFERIYEAHRCQ